MGHIEPQTRQAVQQIAPESRIEAQLLAILNTEPHHVDDLCRQCDLSIKEVNATLTLMELKGMVYQSAPMTYHAVGRN